MNALYSVHARRRALGLASALSCACLVLSACSGDDGDDTPGGNAGTSAGTTAGSSAGTTAGSSAGTTAGSAGTTAGSAGTTAGTTAGATAGTTAGTTAGSAGTSAGTTAGSAGMNGTMDGGADSGSDSGMPNAGTRCVAPTPAASPGNACPAQAPVALQLQLVRDGLNVPIFVTHAPGDDDHLFVALRGGQVLMLDRESGQTVSTFLDLGESIVAASSAGGEFGLLGFAFHPDFPRDGRVFVNYTVDGATAVQGSTAGELDTIVSAFSISASDPDTVDQASEQLLHRFGQPQGNHNGGMLAFGHDGCLYVGSGDGGNGNDVGFGHPTGGNGQSLNTSLGKLLRFDPDSPTTGAPGNLAGASNPHIFDYGLRNPWRFSFDRLTGDVYIGDVGQNAFEEIHVAPRGVGHHNFGWPILEASACLGGGTCERAGLTLPAHEYAHVDGQASLNCVIGGYVYRGEAIPSLQGHYLYGDSGGGRKIQAFVWDGEGACDTPIALSDRDDLRPNARITSFGEDAQGELYVVTSSAVYRIIAAP